MKSSCPVKTVPTIALFAGVAPVKVIVGKIVSIVIVQYAARDPVLPLRSTPCTLR